MEKWDNFTLDEVYPYPLEFVNVSSIIAKIVAVIVYFIQCIGLLLILGIAHYEKYGQDPQKRSFQDRMFGYVCLNYVIMGMIITVAKNVF